jgi:transcriptional regulator with XRE-family HTH domain
MNGMLFYRRKQRRTRKEVAELANLCETTVKKMEEATEHTMPCSFYIAMSDALDVPVEELIAQYPDSLLLPGDHFVRESASCHPMNALANYKKEHNLNFEQLAELLGLAARECARVVCMPADANPEYMATLAALHGISCKEFQRRYGGGTAA